MISILSVHNSQSVQYIEQQINSLGIANQLIIARNNLINSYLHSCCKCNSIVILVGDVFACKQMIAETYSLAMSYDNNLLKTLVNYHKAHNSAMSQSQLDKQCAIPEGFVHFSALQGMCLGCSGKVDNCQVLILSQGNYITNSYNAYVLPAIKSKYDLQNSKQYKIFGLCNKDIMDSLTDSLFDNKFVSHSCETTSGLDSTLLIRFANTIGNKHLELIEATLYKIFGNKIYSTDATLPQEIVRILSDMHKNISIAESITGGMIASSLVSVEGASQVLIESAVTYSPTAKCSRLNINPHMVDSCGVVSSEVASAMASQSKLINNSDFALSITGYAGPLSGDNLPVGLCYIGVASHQSTNVFKVQLSGDRQIIREQATNSALFLLLNTIKNVTM